MIQMQSNLDVADNSAAPQASATSSSFPSRKRLRAAA
jgi:ribosomal protein L14